MGSMLSSGRGVGVEGPGQLAILSFNPAYPLAGLLSPPQHHVISPLLSSSRPTHLHLHSFLLTHPPPRLRPHSFLHPPPHLLEHLPHLLLLLHPLSSQPPHHLHLLSHSPVHHSAPSLPLPPSSPHPLAHLS